MNDPRQPGPSSPGAPVSNPLFQFYDNSLPPGFCKAVVERFDRDPQLKEGRIGVGTRDGAYDKVIKDTVEIPLDGSRPDWNGETKVLLDSLQRHLKQYMAEWGRMFNCEIIHEPLTIARYPIGGQFDWHSDNLGSGITTRVITAIWYLNTVKEGGETEYPLQGMSIKPVEGRFMLCPVGWTYIHRGAPPVSNPKYIAITQLHQRASEQPEG